MSLLSLSRTSTEYNLFCFFLGLRDSEDLNIISKKFSNKGLPLCIFSTSILKVHPQILHSKHSRPICLLSQRKVNIRYFFQKVRLFFGEILRKGNSHEIVLICIWKRNTNQYFLFQFAEIIRLSNIIWLLFLDSCYIPEEFFAYINIPFDCELIVFLQMDAHIILTEVYRVSPTHSLQTHLFGNWTAERGLSISTSGFYKRRNNLQGLVLRTGTVQVRTLLCN